MRKSAFFNFISCVLLSYCAMRPTVDREFVDPQTRVTPTGLAYSSNPAVYVQGAAVTENAPSLATGKATSFSVFPGLPTGLELNTKTGVLSGTATVVAAATNYTVTAKNDAGQTNGVLVITVLASPQLNVDADTATGGAQSVQNFGTLAPNQTRNMVMRVSNTAASGGASLSWNLTESYSYLTTSAVSGALAAGSAFTDVTVTVNSAGLTAGSYSGTIVVSTSTPGTVNATQNIPFSFTVSDQIFVAVGASGKIWRSADGDTWTAVTSPTASTLCSVVFAGSRFVAVGVGGMAVYSTDATATSWLSQNAGGSNHIFDAVANGDNVYASGGNFSFGVAPLAQRCLNNAADSGNETWSSADVSTTAWSAASRTTGSTGPFAIGGANGKYVILNYADTWAYGTDGINFTTRANPVHAGAPAYIFFDVASHSDGSRFMAVGTNSLTTAPAAGVYYTTAPETDASWTAATGAVGQFFITVEYAKDRYVVAGASGKLSYSTNGTSFSAGTDLPGAYTVRAIVYGNSRYVIAGDSGNVHFTASDTFASYTAAASVPGAATIHGLAFGP